MIPKIIKIMGYEWEVCFNKDVLSKDSDLIWGSTHYRTCKIFLDPDLHPRLMREVFLHEVLHIILEKSGIKKMVDEKVDEKIIDGISNGLLYFIEENDINFLKGEKNV